MPAPRKTAPKPCPEFIRVREFISRYVHLPTEADYDLIALWVMGTWTFSPAAPAMPIAYPYLYLTGPKNCGKTHLGVTVLKYLARQHEAITQTTGAALFRLIGTFDEESGEVIPHYPTLAIDEIDATYAGGGSNDEMLRGVGNSGYAQGATVPRAAGKQSIRFPVYCPKLFIGIDNGRLPDTLTSRSIRIDLRQATPEQQDKLTEGPYNFDVEEEAAEIQQMLHDWAKDNAMVFRDYRPNRPEGIHARRWEISRPLIQLAHAAGIEARIVADLTEVFARRAAKATGRQAMFESLSRLLKNNPDAKDFLTRDILAHLEADGVQLPGRGGGKGFQSALSMGGGETREAVYIRLGKTDPRLTTNPITGETQFVARGWKRFQLEEALGEFAAELDSDA